MSCGIMIFCIYRENENKSAFVKRFHMTTISRMLITPLSVMTNARTCVLPINFARKESNLGKKEQKHSGYRAVVAII